MTHHSFYRYIEDNISKLNTPSFTFEFIIVLQININTIYDHVFSYPKRLSNMNSLK